MHGYLAALDRAALGVVMHIPGRVFKSARLNLPRSNGPQGAARAEHGTQDAQGQAWIRGRAIVPPSKARDAELPVTEPVRAFISSSFRDERIRHRRDPSHKIDGRQRTRGTMQKSERFKASGSVKRQRSPIYASSEGEGKIRQPCKLNLSPLPASEQSISSDRPPSDRVPYGARYVGTHLPRTTELLSYTAQLGAFSKVVAQRCKIKAMPNGDSEAELDMIDPEELVKLRMLHMTLKNEREHIKDIYMQGVVTASD